MKSIQEHLRQLLQTVPAFKMLQVPLCLDALFEHLRQSANKPIQDVSQKVTLHLPNSITKGMDGLFKYIMHNKLSNFLCFASLCAHLNNIEQFQLQRREQDLRQMKQRIYRRHPLNRHSGRARIAGGSVSKLHIR